MEEIRVQKYLADCGLMSRRAAEREIEQGNITVNGEVCEIGTKIDPRRDEVRYRGRVIKQQRNARPVYIMLNKPTGYVTTMSDDKGRHCVAELVSDVGVRVYPVGRLDYDSEGLLIMTNDGELTNMLTHPGHAIGKVYLVKVDCELTREQYTALTQPMEIDGYKLQPVLCDIILRKNGYTQLSMVLFEGRNRQIRKMCESVGANVTKLKRVAIGTLELGRLESGKWRYLDRDEVDMLKKCGEVSKKNKARM